MSKQNDSERKKPSWMMEWRIWSIPVGLGIISTVIDLFFVKGQLLSDWNCWGMTILFILIALGSIKKVIPIINNNYLMGAWICWGASILAWLSRLFFRASFHFHI